MSNSNNADHDLVAELLPWYANNTLNPDEQELVAGHLVHCPECRQELAQYRQLDSGAYVVNSAAPVWQPSSAQFSSILQAIDAQENSVDTAAVPLKMPGFFSKLSAGLKVTPRPVYWFMALETAALATLVLLVVARLPQQPEQPMFQTLSSVHTPSATTLPRMSIVFAEDITEKEIRALLQAQHGQLVQGPSMLGVYTLQLETGGEPELQQAIIKLRADPKVKLVEAVTGANR